MELEAKTRPTETNVFGDEEIEISSGKALKIETSPNGEDILNAGPPPGKKWVGRIVVDFKEVDE